tara:strand:+ start:8095 stop:8394 length:300 start_codon:yes stop_codon:yes gene_type:complete
MVKTHKKSKKGGKCKCNSFFGGKKSRKSKGKSRKSKGKTRKYRVMKGGNVILGNDSSFSNPIAGGLTTQGAVANSNVMAGNMDTRTNLYSLGGTNDFVV